MVSWLRVRVRVIVRDRVRVRVRDRVRVWFRVKGEGTYFQTHMHARQGYQACVQ